MVDNDVDNKAGFLYIVIIYILLSVIVLLSGQRFGVSRLSEMLWAVGSESRCFCLCEVCQYVSLVGFVPLLIRRDECVLRLFLFSWNNICSEIYEYLLVLECVSVIRV